MNPILKISIGFFLVCTTSVIAIGFAMFFSDWTCHQPIEPEDGVAGFAVGLFSIVFVGAPTFLYCIASEMLAMIYAFSIRTRVFLLSVPLLVTAIFSAHASIACG